MKKQLLLSLLVWSGCFYAQITLGGDGNGVGALPISTSREYSYSQQIFTKQEINSLEADQITQLVFYIDQGTLIDNSAKWTVFLGHTSKTAFESNLDWIPVSELTHVFEGVVTNEDGAVEINFNNPFFYNNTDNLVIAVHDSSQDYNTVDEHFKKYDATPNSAIFVAQNDDNPDLSSPDAGNRVAYKSVITLYGLSQTLATSENETAKNLIKLYPNPAREVLYLYHNNDQVKTASIHDHLGRLVKKIKEPSSSLDVHDLKEGNFFLSLEMKDGSREFFKFIKK